MDIDTESQQNITTEKALKILKQQGVEISPENVKPVLNFLYTIAEIFHKQHPLQ